MAYPRKHIQFGSQQLIRAIRSKENMSGPVLSQKLHAKIQRRLDRKELFDITPSRATIRRQGVTVVLGDDFSLKRGQRP